jgi:hypothetical protein
MNITECVIEWILLSLAGINVVTSVLLAVLTELPRANGGKRIVRLIFWAQAIAWSCVVFISLRNMSCGESDIAAMIFLLLAAVASLVVKIEIVMWLRE